jgi:hypothetical protein
MITALILLTDTVLQALHHQPEEIMRYTTCGGSLWIHRFQSVTRSRLPWCTFHIRRNRRDPEYYSTWICNTLVQLDIATCQVSDTRARCIYNTVLLQPYF